MYKRMQNFWQLTTLEQCKLTCYCQPGRLGTSCSPSHCTSYYRINTMLWITKLDNCSYQAHWSAWRCCLLKKSSTRRSKPLLWSRESSHPFLCCQSSLMPLWNLAMKRLHRAVWDMHRRCMGECKPLMTYFHETAYAFLSACDKSPKLSARNSRICTCKLGPSLQQIGNWSYQTDETSQLQEYSDTIDGQNIQVNTSEVNIIDVNIIDVNIIDVNIIDVNTIDVNTIDINIIYINTIKVKPPTSTPLTSTPLMSTLMSTPLTSTSLMSTPNYFHLSPSLLFKDALLKSYDVYLAGSPLASSISGFKAANLLNLMALRRLSSSVIPSSLECNEDVYKCGLTFQHTSTMIWCW